MTTRTTRTTRRRTERRPRHVVSTRGAKAKATTATDQRTRHCGPEDLALYACSCGHAFSAGVSTSVACPRCGSGQAW